MPDATPSGTAKKAVVSMTSVEPTHAERIPACPGRREGNWVKKSSESRGNPSIAMFTKSAAKVSTPIIMASTPQAMKTVSQRLRLRISVRSSVAFTKPPAHDVAADVAGEREEEQREAGGEDGLVAGGAVRKIAQ